MSGRVRGTENPGAPRPTDPCPAPPTQDIIPDQYQDGRNTWTIMEGDLWQERRGSIGGFHSLGSSENGAQGKEHVRLLMKEVKPQK